MDIDWCSVIGMTSESRVLRLVRSPIFQACQQVGMYSLISKQGSVGANAVD